MKRLLVIFLLLILFLVIGLPSLLVRGCRQEKESAALPPATVDFTPIVSPVGEVLLTVYLPEKERVMTLSLEEYLVGVVCAEMPAAFAPEALKAQAVSARTYTVNQLRAFGGGGCDRHPAADVCTDSTHCQAWLGYEEALAAWPAEEAVDNLNKIRAAVAATAGEVVTYGGELIDAVFHSHCGGHTENSEDAWSTVVPYLRGVPCPYCAGTRWSETVHEFTGAQFAQAVAAYVAAVPVSAAGRPLLGGAERTSTGRLKSVTIAGETVTGRDLRAALNLPSTNVTWEVTGDKVVFTVKGHGHGVGLCQYGANGMAAQGKTYREILEYYYTGVEVSLLPST